MPSMHHSRAWEQRATSQPQTGPGQKRGEGALSSSFVLLCMPDALELFHFFTCSLVCGLFPPLSISSMRAHMQHHGTSQNPEQTRAFGDHLLKT